MKLNVRSWLSGVALASALLLAACGGGSGGTGGNGGGGALNVTTSGEQLAFQPATLTATAGQATTVTFQNGSSAQQHNWVLVNGGDDVATRVDEAAAANGGQISVGGDVLAATELLAGGASGTANFTAPAAGSYTYLCTFPGHYIAGMKGTLTVQ